MGIKNYLIDGISCAGKTTVLKKLRELGYHCIDGDNELAYFGDIETGKPIDDSTIENRSWIWNENEVREIASNKEHQVSFFCGGSRNSNKFIDIFEKSFILEIDLETLNKRLAARPKTEWGGSAKEGEDFARKQHMTKEGFPKNAITIDATAPINDVVNSILKYVNL